MFHPLARAAGLVALLPLAVPGCSLNQDGLLSADEVGDLSYGEPERSSYAAALDEACGDHELTGDGVATFSRLPYLQSVDASHARVLWTTELDGPFSVRVTAPDETPIVEVEASVDDSAPLPAGAQWEARLEGLPSSAVSCYQIFKGDIALTDRIGLATPPAPGQPVRFAAFGDSGDGSADQYAVLEQLAGLPYQFVTITGDVAYEDGALSSFERFFFDVYADILREIPFFPALGNHDARTAGGTPYLQVFSLPENGGSEGRERWYSYDWGDVHVAVLDTERVGSAQAEWLEADLAATRAPWKVVVGHKPPYSSGSHGSDTNVRQTFGPILERHGVDLALWGHEHDYERTVDINGVTHIVTGGGGRGTRTVGSSDFTAFALQVAHFVYVEVAGDDLTLWAIDATGEVFDSLRLTHAPS